MTERQILKALGQVNETYLEEAEQMQPTKKQIHWKKWSAAAACLALAALLLAGILQRNRYDTVTLANGDTLRFTQANSLAFSQDWARNVRTRELTDAEMAAMFGDMAAEGEGVFAADGQQEFLGWEGYVNRVKLVLSAPGVSLLDTVIDGTEAPNTVLGVPVTAGFFVTGPNSRGTRNAIYYVSFDWDGYGVYLEHGGAQQNSQTVKQELAAVAEQLIQQLKGANSLP